MDIKQNIDDLVLEVDSDLSIYSFVEAMELLAWHKVEIEGLIFSGKNAIRMTVSQVDAEDAQKISELADITFTIDSNLDAYTWILHQITYIDGGKIYEKRVYNAGA